MSQQQLKNFVQKTILSGDYILFTKSYCGYSQTAKQLLLQRGIPFKALDIDLMKDGQALQKVLTSMYNHSTVPYVFIKGKFIGGCSELKNLMKSSGINHSSHSYSLYQEDSDIE